MNHFLGAKIVWNLVNNSHSWWKSSLLMKYTREIRSSKHEGMMNRDKCTNIWKICKASTPIILDNLFWQPSNGKNINLRFDKFCDMGPLQEQTQFTVITN